MWRETKTEAEWLYFESFSDESGYKTLFFFAKDPNRRRRFCICEAKTGMRLFSSICKLDDMTFQKITREFIRCMNVREQVVGIARVSRLPNYEEEEKQNEN